MTTANPDNLLCAALALELSGRQGSIALGMLGSPAAPDVPIRSEQIQKQTRHDDDLMPAIQRLFQASKAARSQLRQVYVSIGPGGFTGLRVAVATAKMLAYALSARIYAIPTAEVIASQIPPPAPGTAGADPGQTEHRRVLAVCLARKHGCYWTQCFSTGPAAAAAQHPAGMQIGGWLSDGHGGRLLNVQQIATIEGLTDLAIDLHQPEIRSNAGMPHHRRTCGDWHTLAAQDDQYLARKCAEIDDSIVIHPASPTAAACWHLGHQVSTGRHASLFEISPQNIAPLYPRQPEAVTLWQQRNPERR